MLFVAALARPTVELVAAAHGDRERVLEALETAAQEGVIELDDSRIRFAHPLLASICYERAPVWKRRAVHQALADVGRRTSRSVPATWRSPRTGPDAASPPSWTPPPSRPPAAGRPPPRPSSASSLPS